MPFGIRELVTSSHADCCPNNFPCCLSAFHSQPTVSSFGTYVVPDVVGANGGTSTYFTSDSVTLGLDPAGYYTSKRISLRVSSLEPINLSRPQMGKANAKSSAGLLLKK